MTAIGGVFTPGQRVEVDEERVERLIEAISALLAPDAETVMQATDPAFRGVYRGPEGLREAWRDWLETWERVEFDVEGVELTEGAVISLALQRGVTRHGGVELEQPSAAVFVFDRDQVSRIEFHLDREAARRAARQSSQA